MPTDRDLDVESQEKYDIWISTPPNQDLDVERKDTYEIWVRDELTIRALEEVAARKPASIRTLVQRYFHGRSRSEIAKADGVVKSTVNKRCDSGLKLVRESIWRQLGECERSLSAPAAAPQDNAMVRAIIHKIREELRPFLGMLAIAVALTAVGGGAYQALVESGVSAPAVRGVNEWVRASLADEWLHTASRWEGARGRASVVDNRSLESLRDGGEFSSLAAIVVNSSGLAGSMAASESSRGEPEQIRSGSVKLRDIGIVPDNGLDRLLIMVPQLRLGGGERSAMPRLSAALSQLERDLKIAGDIRMIDQLGLSSWWRLGTKNAMPGTGIDTAEIGGRAEDRDGVETSSLNVRLGQNACDIEEQRQSVVPGSEVSLSRMTRGKVPFQAWTSEVSARDVSNATLLERYQRMPAATTLIESGRVRINMWIVGICFVAMVTMATVGGYGMRPKWNG